MKYLRGIVAWIASLVGIANVWNVIKLVSVFCLAFVLLIGCGEQNLDDPKVREKIIAEVIDIDNLQTRRAPSGEELRYAPNQEQPYTGWAKGWVTDEHQALLQFKHGKRHGTYISWYSNGQNSEKGTYKNDEKVGLWTEWFENGQKFSEGTYKNGEKDGVWVYWYKHGEEYGRETYKDGENTSEPEPIKAEQTE